MPYVLRPLVFLTHETESVEVEFAAGKYTGNAAPQCRGVTQSVEVFVYCCVVRK
jgi:hypothetical protein